MSPWIVFGDGFSIQPRTEALVLFPGNLRHEVPVTRGRRLVVSMNVFKQTRAIAPSP